MVVPVDCGPNFLGTFCPLAGGHGEPKRSARKELKPSLFPLLFKPSHAQALQRALLEDASCDWEGRPAFGMVAVGSG